VEGGGEGGTTTALVLGGSIGLLVFGGSSGASVLGGGGGASVFGGSAGLSVFGGSATFVVFFDPPFFAAASTWNSPSTLAVSGRGVLKELGSSGLPVLHTHLS
jgi:hypothetical protein